MGSLCLAGLCAPQTVFTYTSLIYVASLALDTDYVYGGGALVGTDAGTPGIVARLAKRAAFGLGGAAIAVTQTIVVRVALAGPEIVWTQGAFGDAGIAARGVGHAPKVPPSDAGFVPLYVGNQVSPFSIAADDSTLYWSNYGSSSAGYDLWSVSRADPSTARPIIGPEGIAGVAVDSTAIYYSTALPIGDISRANKDGTNEQPLAKSQSTPFLLALDDAFVYWTEFVSGGSVSRVQKDGGAVLQLATGQDNPTLIAVDDNFVYWTTYTPGASQGTLNRAPKGGGKQLTLAVGLAATDIAVDDAYVYVATLGTVIRVPK
jgi:hypothetical protein